MEKINKVLLVEDDETTIFISKMALKKVGIEDVSEAVNGRIACDHLKNECSDLIFLDLNMPVMDGWEFLEEKKETGFCKDIKIVILSSSTHPEDKKKATSYDSVIAYIEKPLTIEKVEGLMR